MSKLRMLQHLSLAHSFSHCTHNGLKGALATMTGTIKQVPVLVAASTWPCVARIGIEWAASPMHRNWNTFCLNTQAHAKMHSCILATPLIVWCQLRWPQIWKL